MSGSRRSSKLRLRKYEGVMCVEVLASKVICNLHVFIEDRIRPFYHKCHTICSAEQSAQY
jgi:hypothetical protein